MSTDRFTHFRAKAADVSAFPFFARVTFPPVASVMEILRELFIAVTRDKVTLPEKPIEDAVFSVRGDGLMKLNDSYLMLVHDNVSVEVEKTQIFHLRARTEPDLIYAVRTLRFAMELKGCSWKDDFTKLPKRADRARIEAEVGAFIDPAPAWALHGGIHPRWVFLEEQFETCTSCGGSALDSYAGACYACSYNGKNLVGWKHLPYPSKLSDVILLASDLAAMEQAATAVATLAERLSPWGAPACTKLEWVVAESHHGSGIEFDHIPSCMVKVVEALSQAVRDPTIRPGLEKGWVTQCRSAWKESSFSSRPDPFEPLAVIMGAGYWIASTQTPDAIRLSCHAH